MGTTASRMSTILNAHLISLQNFLARRHSSLWRPMLPTRASATSKAPQKRTKVSDVFYALKVEDFLNEIGALRCAEDRGDQVAGFGGDFVARHGIFRSAADIIDAPLETGAVGECELHDGHAEGHEALQFGIEDSLNGRADGPALDVGARDFIALA